MDASSFEIVSTETLAHAGTKAAQLCGRGVRRVFAIDVGRIRAFEWSHELGTWGLLDASTSIEDPTLAASLPIAALLDAAKTDDAIARALLAKGNPVLVAAVAEGRAEGRAAGRAEDILLILARRGIDLGAGERARILGERDLGELERWLMRAVTCSKVADLFADG